MVNTRETLVADIPVAPPDSTALQLIKLDRVQFGEVIRRLSGELKSEVYGAEGLIWRDLTASTILNFFFKINSPFYL